ncbi:accessory Sec system protein translocase subunit SecY2 [Granulicatella sp. zg-ZJ]|nr:accessory Sec system protein translocase subunit SecY2 [Granulicatella sp. zg-ZJ]
MVKCFITRVRSLIMSIMKYLKNRVILRKVSFTLGIIFIYLLGTHLTVSKDVYVIKQLNELSVIGSMLGADYTQLSIFTLGLAPWMSTMILWRGLSIFKRLELDKKSHKKINGWQMRFIFILAVIQALTFVLLNMRGKEPSLLEIITLCSVLVTGVFVLMFLVSMNTAYGIGGFTIIIIVGIVRTITKRFVTYFFNGTPFDIYKLLLCIYLFFVILILITLDRAERRIEVNRLMINNAFQDKSYLSIRLNTSGGMSIMYTFTILMLPQYLFQLLNYTFPEQILFQQLIDMFRLTNVSGVTIYSIVLFFLTIGFSFLNIDPEDIAKTLRNSGDYISGLRPGKETKEYLHQIILRLSFVNAITLTLFAGVPLYIGVFDKSFSEILTLPGSVMLLVGLTLSIYDQLSVLTIKKNYHSLF